MLKDLVVGKSSARLGKEITALNTFTVDGESYKLPAYLVNGAREGPTLELSDGATRTAA